MRTGEEAVVCKRPYAEKPRFRAIRKGGSFDTELSESEDRAFKDWVSARKRLQTALFEASDAKQRHQDSLVKIAELEQQNLALRRRMSQFTFFQNGVHKFGFFFLVFLLMLALPTVGGTETTENVEGFLRERVTRFCARKTLCALSWPEPFTPTLFLNGKTGNGDTILTGVRVEKWLNEGDVDWKGTFQVCKKRVKTPNECALEICSRFQVYACLEKNLHWYSEVLNETIKVYTDFFALVNKDYVTFFLQLIMFIITTHHNWWVAGATASYWLGTHIMGSYLTSVWDVPTYGVPLIMITLMIRWAPIQTAFLYMFSILCPIPLQTILWLIHWIFMVFYVLLRPEPKEESVLTLAYINMWAFLLPIVSAGTWMLQRTHLSFFLQMLMIAASTVLWTGMRLSGATIMVTNPDGTVEKRKRFEPLKRMKTMYHTLQTRLRGVIPPFRVKAKSVANVMDNEHITGSCWRFGNFIYVLGHLVPAGTKTVTVNWEGVTASAKVRKQIALPNTSEFLLECNLPVELAKMPPFKRSRILTSDYCALWFNTEEGKASCFLGWALVDNLNFIRACFGTIPGVSGGAYTDQYGRLMGVHIGNSGSVSVGVMLITILTELEKPQPKEGKVVYVWPDGTHHTDPYVPPEDKRKPVPFEVKERKESKKVKVEFDLPPDDDPDKKAGYIVDDDLYHTLMEHAAEMARGVCKENLRVLQSLIEELREDMGVGTYREESKGKTKRKKRMWGGGVQKTKKTRNSMYEKIMRENVLTDELYKELVESGKSKKELQQMVRNLRWNNWVDYCEKRDWDPDNIYDEMEEAEADQQDTDYYESENEDQREGENSNRLKKKKRSHQQFRGTVRQFKPESRTVLPRTPNVTTVQMELAPRDDQIISDPDNRPGVCWADCDDEDPIPRCRHGIRCCPMCDDFSSMGSVASSDEEEETIKPTEQSDSVAVVGVEVQPRQEANKGKWQKVNKKKGKKETFCYTCQEMHPPGVHSQSKYPCRHCHQEINYNQLKDHSQKCEAKNKAQDPKN
ncbi:non-structural polyprotein [Rhesus monkey astrovirus]|nr:non-structural polyprotein [Rhesus monkey astrovirus]